MEHALSYLVDSVSQLHILAVAQLVEHLTVVGSTAMTAVIRGSLVQFQLARIYASIAQW